ncbi:hypothetical protein J4226_05925 [Candidatus Pacearchaeota archaeon]|nr:hypothetical protein [Candidatus Pacearchaeota archaeon]
MKMQENNLTGILIWIVGVIISLTVGSAMINKTLLIPMIPAIVTIVSGWVVIIGSIISVILMIFNK